MNQDEEKVIDEILFRISEYKENARFITYMLREIEAERTRIINYIEEATHKRTLSRRMSHRLEDKLVRPYSFDLIKS